MKCPICQKEMKMRFKDVSKNFRNDKQYDRTYFICENDDVYVTIEVPKNG